MGFRQAARVKANSLDIKGFARNEPDGSVYIEAESEEKALNEFVEWFKNGPLAAKIEGVEIEAGTMRNLENFLII